MAAPLCLLGLATFAMAATIPVELPPPDAGPPATDKPVKVYILSGQSNMVGFGAVNPAPPQYTNVFLSADPTAMPTALGVSNSALLKHGIHEATAAVYDAAEGEDWISARRQLLNTLKP